MIEYFAFIVAFILLDDYFLSTDDIDAGSRGNFVEPSSVEGEPCLCVERWVSGERYPRVDVVLIS